MDSSSNDQINSSTSPLSTRFLSAYSPKQRSRLYFPEQGRTKQSFKDECDINVIMGRYLRTGMIDHLAQTAPRYADVEALDFQGAMDIVVAARDRFAQLPSELRDRFSNDPGRLLAFIQNPANIEEARKLGLLAPEAPPQPQAGTSVPPSLPEPPKAP